MFPFPSLILYKGKKKPSIPFLTAFTLPQLDTKFISKLPAVIKVLRSTEPQHDRPKKSWNYTQTRGKTLI